MEEIELYDVIKILHIAAVISWFAGLLYLPRIFVYHTQVAVGSETDKIFQIMEKKLMHFIMLPSILLVFAFGFYLASEIGFGFVWLHIKITLVLILAAYHGFLSRCRKNFALGKNKYSEKFYRIINEVPAVLMIIIIALVILKPF
ncbi:MAG: protoporphyrinogen oxidase HemJ [Proteobacteria bacterium]|nr:protoporphyrinogen oxidase HemJ [Pseudomonadota bacterium]